MLSTTSNNRAFCPRCDDVVDVEVDDQSFDHEFGTEWLYDFKCADCGKTLATHTGSKLRAEIEPE